MYARDSGTSRTGTSVMDRPSNDQIRELVERAQGGDASAYADLYRSHHRYVGRIVAEGMADADARNDVSQAVFEQAWVKLDTLRDPGAFRPWIAQITRRMIVDHHRKSSRAVVTDFTDTDEWAEPVANDWSAHDWAAMRELASAVNLAVTGLSERDVTVLDLATTFGFGAAEIAAALDINPGHARVLLHRARQRLSAELGATLSSEHDA